jgi:hypothetical protein
VRSFSLSRVQRLTIAAILVIMGMLTASIFSPSTRAATPYWSPVPLGGGGMSNLVRYDPANGNYVLMGDDIGGIHYSSDGGNTWQTRARAACPRSDHVASIVWNPALSNVAYALVGDGKYGCLLVSTDHGLDWSDASSALIGNGSNTPKRDPGLPAPQPRSVGNLVAVDTTRHLIYVGTFRDGVWRAPLSSTGIPGTFSQIALASSNLKHYYVRSLIADPRVPSTLYVAVQTGRRSLGNGQALRILKANGRPQVQVFSGGPHDFQDFAALDGNLYGVANDPAGPGASGLFRLASSATVSASTRWQHIDLEGRPRSWYSITARKSSGVESLWVTSVGAVPSPTGAYRFIWHGTSTNDFESGATWKMLPAKPSDMVNDIAGPGATGVKWWALNTGGNFCWAGRTKGFVSTGISVSPSDSAGNTWIFSGRCGAWRTSNGGRTWYPVVAGDNILDDQRVVADSSTAGQVAIGNIDWTGFVSTDSFSDDAKRLAPTTDQAHDGWSVAWDTGTSPSTLYLGAGARDSNTSGQVWMRQQGSAKWTEVGANIDGSGARPVGLAVVRNPSSPSVPILLADVQGSGIWRKVGSGSWAKASGFTTAGAGWPQRAEFAWLKGETIVYAYDNTSGLWRSTDFGRSWTRISPITSAADNRTGFIAAVPGNQNQLVFSSMSSVQLLTNAGSAEADGATGPDLDLPSGQPGPITVSNAGKLYASNDASGVWRTTLTASGTTGGWTSLADDTWRNMVRSPEELSVDANGTVYAALSGGALALRGG